MKSFARTGLVLLLLVTACKQKETQTDQLYQFKEYLAYHSQGIRSIHGPITLDFAQAADGFELDQELPNSYFKIKPKVKGSLIIKNKRSLIFTPEKPMDPNTEYTVTADLEPFIDGLPKDKRSFTFSFKTMPAGYKVNIGELQSYSKEYQYLSGTVQASDGIFLDQAKQLLKVNQDGDGLSVKWDSVVGPTRYFNFIIDSISRKESDGKIHIQWDGSAISSDHAGASYYDIPGRDNFKVLEVNTATAPQSQLTINFSDPVDPNQNFSGLIGIGDSQNLRFEADGNLLFVYPETRPLGELELTVFAGLKNIEGYSLKNPFYETVSFDPLKPEVRLLSKGTIIPDAENNPIYFEAVNLSQVEVRVVEIFQDNMLQFLQESSLNNTDDYYMRRVGRRVAKKTITLVDTNFAASNSWKAHALDLGALFNASPGSVYRVELSYRPEYSLYPCDDVVQENTQDEYYEDDYYYEEEVAVSNDPEDEEELETRYWDNEIYRWRNFSYNWQERDNPCHPAYYNSEKVVHANILASDLGLIVKKGTNSTYHIFTTDLISSKPEPGVEISLYNYQQQRLYNLTTDAQGKTIFDADLTASFVIAKKGNHYAYARLGDADALSLSKFDVAGSSVQKGLKGFLYAERGVHRPGDSIHLTFVLNDQANPLPANHPVKLEVTDARGKLVVRKVAQNGVNGFYYFPIATAATAPTGNWNATVKVGGASFGKTLRVAAIKPNRLKIQLDFDNQILEASKPISGVLKSSWLHGAPARNLDVRMDLTVAEAQNPFKNLSQYTFNDPVRSFYPTEFAFTEASLSADGELQFSEQLAINERAPGMLQASFVTKVYEGGGDFSIDVVNKPLAPYTHFVGVNAPEPGNYGQYDTDSDHEFDVVSVNAQGQPAGNRNLEVQVFEISWRWWWNRGSDNLSRYENSSVYRPFKKFSVSTNASGKGSFTVNIPDERDGRFLIRVIDTESGHATGTISYFFKNWWQTGQAGSDSAKMLLFSADRTQYSVGDQAKIQFPSSAGSTALISIENGTEVLVSEWVTTQDEMTTYTLDISPEMAPNVFVNISLLQPHARTENDLPMRLYGIIPMLVSNPETVLKPELSMPGQLKPESDYQVQVSEASGKAMTYTLAVVDEGLLDLTRFGTPDIHSAFYARQALGVKTFDIFDLVMGAFSTQVDQIYAIGGGDAAAGAKNRKADRFKPVVSYIGPFKLAANQTATHNLTMPNYVGSVKTMVVAGNNPTEAYGKAEKVTPVRTPLMVLASVPRKLSPQERMTLPVTVFAMDPSVKQAEVSIETGDALKAVGPSTKTVRFDAVGEQIVNFEFEIQPTDQVQQIKVKAQSGSHKASYPLEIDVLNPNLISRESTLYTLEAGQNKTVDFRPFGTAGTNKVTLELSTLPPMNIEGRMSYLIRYPHGCVEQTTSGAFPQLFLKDIVDLSSAETRKIEDNLKGAIARLGQFQNSSGGLGYWMGESSPNDWGTSYAGHFMIEAQQQGYSLPVSFMSNWVNYQRRAARQWRSSSQAFNTTLAQAYRLYTLALSGNAELAAMNRLRQSPGLTNDAKWRLAGAYALTGNEKVAKELINSASIQFSNSGYSWYTYGSAARNKAMALEIMTLISDSQERDMAVSVAAELSSDRWLNTQETAYSLMALGKMVKANGGKSVQLELTQNGQAKSIKSDKSIVQQEIPFSMSDNQIRLNNTQGNRIYVNLIRQGKYPMGAETSSAKNLSVQTFFTDKENNAITVSELRQGTEFKATIIVQNTSNDNLRDLALTQLVPSGWEIVNTSFTDGVQANVSQARYTDIRDDRVNYYFDLRARQNVTFELVLNASYLGRYYLAGTQVATMYSNNYYARKRGEWIEVKQ